MTLLKHVKRFNILLVPLVHKLKFHVTFSQPHSHHYIESSNHSRKMKLDNELFHSIVTPELLKLTKLFESNGYEIKLAGGAVRDLLMGIKPSDVDFATTATPEEMKTLFTKEKIRMINMKGEEHGTITARIDDKENFEITTLRIDVCTDGRRAKVEFTKNWELDASRRDLTINALFLGLDGVVYDYFSGIEDIRKKKIVFVGQPEKRIQEDYLRILRYFRFYGRIAELPDEHDTLSIEAIKNNAAGLKRVSGERIWAELKKILSGRFSYSLLKKMLECNLANSIGLPDNPSLDCLQKLELLENEGKFCFHPITVLSTLLNTEDEMIHLHARLKFSAYERDLGYFLLSHRSKPPDFRELKSILVDAKEKKSDVKKWVCELLHYIRHPELAVQINDWNIPKLPIRGNAPPLRGLRGPKQIRFVMDKLKEAWKESDYKLTATELEELAPSLIEEYNEKVIHK